MSDAEDVAISALREAVRAVSIGKDAAASAVPSQDREPDVAREVGRLMEAVARLLRSTDLDAVPSGGSNHRLHAIVQHLDAGAEFARRLEDRDADAPSDAGDAIAELGRRGSGEDRAASAGGGVGDGLGRPSMPETRRATDPS